MEPPFRGVCREIELFAENRGVAISITHGAYEPTPAVANINDPLSHHPSSPYTFDSATVFAVPE